MKKYFFIVLLSIIFVTLLLAIRPKATPTNLTPDLVPSPTIFTTEKLPSFSNSKYFYKFSCPTGSTRSIEVSTGDGTVMPYFQETCHLENNQARIYVHTISFYESISKDPSLKIENYLESTQDGFKTISFSASNDADYYEIFLTPSRVISLRGYDKNYFSIIKNSLSIINYPTPTLQIIPLINILDTSTWQTNTCRQLSFKSPPNSEVTCNPNSTITVKVGDKTAVIMIKNYNGGSRKDYWVEQSGLESLSLSKISRIDDNNFGQNSGLDFFVDGQESPILINSGNTIIIILGGRSYDAKTGVITRWDITDTIASTVKIND